MSSKKLPGRLVVYSKDIENITGLMPRTARKLLQRIRQAFGKPQGAFVTSKEFCLYTGIEEELVQDYLRWVRGGTTLLHPVDLVASPAGW